MLTKLFFFLPFGGYVFILMLKNPLSIDTVFYFFIFYLFFFDTLEIIKDNISNSNFKKIKIFLKKYMFFYHEKIIRMIKPLPLSLLLFWIVNLFNDTSTPLIILICYIFFLYVLVTNSNRIKTSIKSYIFPPSIEASLRENYPLLTNKQREEVLNYLRLFLIDKVSNISSDTPSIVLNRTWEVFSLSDEYEAFSYQFFNMDILPYKPILKDSSGIIELPNIEMNFLDIWKSQCYIEEIDPFFPQRVPSMFMLDETLNIADGIKFHIYEECLREELRIEDAPSTKKLIKEIEDGTSQKYLAKKLKYYLGNKSYCKLYIKEELEDLLKKIQKNESLSKMVFGEYSDINFFIENVLNNAMSPAESACSSCSGSSV
ncbi:MAG: hypothetical protein DSZ11_00375 [Sulfurovum sp.]|nr:MAG: hypothetical protein DSZ11_00375 [Sulfurovum sp.]